MVPPSEDPNERNYHDNDVIDWKWSYLIKNTKNDNNLLE